MGTKTIERFWFAKSREEIERFLREELETAWLRGFQAGFPGLLNAREKRSQLAADYAERVVGGSTRPERPEVRR